MAGAFYWLQSLIQAGGRNSKPGQKPDRLDLLFEQANAGRFEGVRTGPELENRIYHACENREHSLVLGLPGCGKTHNAEVAIKGAKVKGVIGNFLQIQGTKDLNGDALFEPRMRVDAQAEKYVTIDPPVLVALVGIEALLPADVYSREEAKAEWALRKTPWGTVILDECTRCSAQFIDHLLSILEHFIITYDGKNYRIPITWVFLGNPPGMDSTASVLTPAFFSRIISRTNLLDMEVDLQVSVVLESRVRSAAKVRQDPAWCQPTVDYLRLAASCRFLLWGLPLDRKGMVWLPDTARELIAEAARLNADLAYLMEEIGKITVFGPDSRRTTAWLLNAQSRAALRDETFSDEHLLATAEESLQLGSKDTFTEGHRPDLMRRKVRLIVLIVKLALEDKQVRELLLRRTDPKFLATDLATRMFHKPTDETIKPTQGENSKQGQQQDPMNLLIKQLSEWLREHVKRLKEDRHPDAKVRSWLIVMFFNRVLQLNPAVNPEQVAQSIPDLAQGAADPKEALFKGNRFVCRADQELFAHLDQIPESLLTPIGQAVAHLYRVPVAGSDSKTAWPIRALTVTEQVRLAVLETKFVGEYSRVLQLAAENCQQLEDHLKELALLLEAMLEASTNEAGTAAGLAHWDRCFARQDSLVRQAALNVIQEVRDLVTLPMQPRFDNFLIAVRAKSAGGSA